MAAAAEVDVRHRVFYRLRADQFAVDAEMLVHLGAPAHGAHCGIGMRQGEVSAFRIEQVQVEIGRQVLPQAQRLVVERNPFRGQIVGSDDGGVAAGIAAADIAFFEHRHIGDAVIARQVIGRRQSMAATTDNDHVVARLQRIRHAKHARFRIFAAKREAQ